MIKICQYLCPNRHAIVAAAYEPDQNPAEVEAQLRTQLATMEANPWCGLCGSTKLRFEHADTLFATMTEAIPALMREEQKNILAMAHLNGMHKPN